MRCTVRFLLILLVALAGGACSVAETPVTPRMTPERAPPTFLRVKATDSMMVETITSYPDTAMVLTRTTALATDLVATAVIGSAGGELSIAGAGVVVKIPAGALASSTTITMTAVAGAAVAYSFAPHGLVFAKPVKIEQSLAGTSAAVSPQLLANAHAGYFEGSLESAFVDAAKTRVKVKENQLTYHDNAGGKLKFAIGHFSGYILACGAVDESSTSN